MKCLSGRDPRLWIVVWALGLIFSGCEGDSDSAPEGVNVSGQVDVSGTWSATADGGLGDNGTLTLAQNGSSVHGTFATGSGYHGSVSGSANGRHLTVTLNYASGHSTLDAAVSEVSMSGTYAAVSGQSGTFAGTRL